MHTKLPHLLQDRRILATGAIALLVGIGIGYGAHSLTTPRLGSEPTFGAAGMNGTGFAARSGTQARTGTANGLLTGTVAAKDATSLTLNTRDGSSHVVLVTPATEVSKSASGTLDDVTVGSTIIVSGTANSTGSVSASLIQLRPGMPAGPQAR